MRDQPRLSKDELQEIVVKVAGQIGFAVPQTRELAIYLLENVNDHTTAAALRAVALEDVGLACDFLRCGTSGKWVSSLPPEGSGGERDDLFRRLKALQKSRKR